MGLPLLALALQLTVTFAGETPAGVGAALAEGAAGAVAACGVTPTAPLLALSWAEFLEFAHTYMKYGGQPRYGGGSFVAAYGKNRRNRALGTGMNNIGVNWIGGGFGVGRCPCYDKAPGRGGYGNIVRLVGECHPSCACATLPAPKPLAAATPSRPPSPRQKATRQKPPRPATGRRGQICERQQGGSSCQ